MYFDVAGPFTLKRYGSKNLITSESISNLKEQAENHLSALSSAIGCYVFAIRAGKGFTPWYVGQAKRRPIADEALNPSNREKYNKLEGKGTPIIFFVHMITPKGKFRKPTERELPELDFLERWLIATCLDKNQALVNNKETRFLRGIRVTGVFNAMQGEAHAASSALNKALWRGLG